MRDHQQKRPGSRRAPIRLWAERLLVGAGAATLIWAAVLIGDAAVAQWMARGALETALLAKRPVLTPVVEQPTHDRPRHPAVHAGSPIAALTIPRVRLSAVVLHGSDTQTLRRGPGHLEDTAFPGEAGNVVIAGHRDSFFAPLREIQLGDDIFLDTAEGQFHYEVTSARVVSPRDLTVLASTGEAVLTLITCYPFWVFGHAPDRFVVRAAAVVNGAAAPPPSRQAPRPGPVAAAFSDGPGDHQVARPAVAAVHDDETLVRSTVERYRLTYNARLVSRRDVRARGPLRFETCDVALAEDRATATCETRRRPLSDVETHVRTFLLERVDGGWAIRSIVLQ